LKLIVLGFRPSIIASHFIFPLPGQLYCHPLWPPNSVDLVLPVTPTEKNPSIGRLCVMHIYVAGQWLTVLSFRQCHKFWSSSRNWT